MESRWGNGVQIVVALITTAVVGVVVWLHPGPADDLFVSLAGGREVVQGQLGRPDTWSLFTEGRVWINQSWGADFFLYLVHAFGGDGGLFVLKALLLAGLLALIAAVARLRGVRLPVALVAGAGALAVCLPGPKMGPELLGLLLIPLFFWVLYRSANRLSGLLGAALLVGLWANLHVTFLIGVLALVVWALCRVVAGLLSDEAASGKVGVVLAAAALAVVLAAWVNPFGLRNLTLPLEAVRSEEWRAINGWSSLFDGEEPVAWGYLVLCGFVVLVGAIRLFRRCVRERRILPQVGVGGELFESLLVVLTVLVSLHTRSVIPAGAVLLAPIAALQLEWLNRRGLAVLAVSAGLLLAMGIQYGWMSSYYRPDNPLRPAESLAARAMQLGTRFPEGAARFLTENQIQGRLFHSGMWEGYLHWKAPIPVLFAGKRGHEMYTPEPFNRHKMLLRTSDPGRTLRKLEIPLVVVPLDLDYAILCQRLLVGADSSWAYVYCDRRSAVLADTSDTGGKRLVQRAISGTLRYPDPAVGALSRAMALASPASGSRPQFTVTALELAVRLAPTEFAYSLLIHRARTGGVDREELIQYLEDQETILSKMDVASPDGIQVLRSRQVVTTALRRIYDQRTEKDKWDAVSTTSQALGDRIEALEAMPWAVGLLKRFRP